MGAEKPVFDPKGVGETRAESHFSRYFLMAAALMAFFLLFPMIGQQDGGILLVPSEKEQRKLEKRLREIDDSEQYALVAVQDGWYPCRHSGRTQFYLLKGEIWKYGVTGKGQVGRYTISFLQKNAVAYVIQFRGTFSECLKQEQIKLFEYPSLPENLARPLHDRLPRPPNNPIMR